ncbi:MAG: hypothetical protein IPJ74_22625 [Saprospiraceae bacterium]|nr:hypothetical protein [Saprospiraceae bacterium]
MKKVMVVIGLSVLASCVQSYKSQLPGKWQAVEVLEDEMPMDVNTEVIQFQFGKNNDYKYFGNLKYKEAGTYYIESKYLYTLDTVNQASTEKAVEIVKLTGDSLFLKMNDNGRERLMKLIKLK